MPRGRYVNHKGRSRHFTSPEELEEERRKKAQRKTDDNESEEESSEEAKSSNDDDSDESGSDSDNHKNKGVQGLIEIENPNRAVRKTAEKVTKITLNEAGAGGSSKSDLSRREREEIEKQRAQAHYQKLHAEGKTDQARADLARLAIIKQHRAEAAARRDAEKKEKEERSKKAAAK